MAGNSGNVKNPSWYSGGMSSWMSPGAGAVYYVNGGSDGPADNAFDGLTPATPKQTLTAALALCVSENNDYIIVLNYGSNGRAAEPSFPITVTKTMVHIIGVGTVGAKWPVIRVLAPGAGDTAAPALLITADRVEVANLIFGGGTTAGAIHVGDAGGAYGVTIHDCFFGVGDGGAVGQDGIRIPAGTAAPFLTVYGCRFGAQLTRDGIRFDANATRCMIGVPGEKKNYFRQLPGIAINVAAAVTEPGIHDNVISIPANTGGAGITLGAAVLDAWVFGNVANFGDTDMGNNPFADGAAGGANDWGNNMQGITLVQPS